MSDYDFTLKITDYNSGTVTLTSSPFALSKYHSRTEARGVPTLAETCEVRLSDGSAAANLDEVRSLSQLLDQARESQLNRTLDKVYIEFTDSSGGTAYRSELKEARVEWNDTALDYPHWTGDIQFATLYWERTNWWEGSEAQVPLSNSNGTATLNALAVFNCNDSGGTIPALRENYIDIGGTSIAGDLPAATRLEITNTYATSRMVFLWIGQNYTNPTTFNHHYEAEDATHSGTAVAGSQYSGGTTIQFPVPTGAETEVLNWTISAAQMSAAAGRYFKFMPRHAGFSANEAIYWRVRIKWNDTTLWQSEQNTVDPTYTPEIRDVTTFRIPPWLMGLSNLDSLNLVFTAYQNTGSQLDQTVDYVELMPVDGWRHLRYIGYGTAQNYRIVDDGINDRVYQDDGSGNEKIGLYIGYGHQIELKPGKDQRLYFLNHGVAPAQSNIDRSLSIKLYYRPRRLTL